MNVKKPPKIAIVDYGLGNLFSIKKALEYFTNNVTTTEDGTHFNDFDGMIIPGVGSYKAGMAGLKVRGLIEPIRAFARSGKPVLGICLGAQLMLEKGYEFGECDGLGIIGGEAVKFPKLPANTKIPHIGWNKIEPSDSGVKDKLLSSIKPDSFFYFVHSYVIKPTKKENILAETEYGGYKFCSIIKSGNIYGCQFHPEKSGTVGLRMIKNFLELTKKHA